MINVDCMTRLSTFISDVRIVIDRNDGRFPHKRVRALLDKREEMYSKLVPFLPENEREMFVSAFEGIGGAEKFLHGQEGIRVCFNLLNIIEQLLMHINILEEEKNEIELFLGDVLRNMNQANEANDNNIELLSNKLIQAKEKWKTIDEVPPDETDQIERLETAICKEYFANVRHQLTIPDDINYVGVLRDKEGKMSFTYFQRNDDATSWTREIQREFYKNETKWEDNPFTCGVIIHLRNESQSCLCLTENSINYSTSSEIRPHTFLSFKVLTKSGEFVTVDGSIGRYVNCGKLEVIIDTGCTLPLHLHETGLLKIRQFVWENAKQKLVKGSHESPHEKSDISSLIFEVCFPCGKVEIDCGVNVVGNVLGVPAFEHFNGVFTFDSSKRIYEFVKNTSC